jgi:hypothetical protein
MANSQNRARPEFGVWPHTVDRLIDLLHKAEAAAARASADRDQVRFGEARRLRSRLLAEIDRAKVKAMTGEAAAHA